MRTNRAADAVARQKSKWGKVRPLTVIYAAHPTRKGDRPLEADVYLPDGTPATDLLVWMHSGGFRSGTRSHRNHARIAVEFARHGYATAFIDYRLARPPAILRLGTEARLALLIDDARAAGEEMHETFFGARPLGVVEDCCAFLNFAETQKTTWNLSGRYLVGGSSAGAISALNTLYLPQALGLSRPPVATVLAYSGGFAYPSYLGQTGARILAQACPSDERVPVSSIRRYCAALTTPGSDRCVLIEHPHYAHGDLGITPTEPLRNAVARAVAFDRAADPRGMSVDIPGSKVSRSC